MWFQPAPLAASPVYSLSSFTVSAIRARYTLARNDDMDSPVRNCRTHIALRNQDKTVSLYI